MSAPRRSSVSLELAAALDRLVKAILVNVEAERDPILAEEGLTFAESCWLTVLPLPKTLVADSGADDYLRSQLARLVRQGLAQREPSSNRIMISDGGRVLLARLELARLTALIELVAPLAETERCCLLTALRPLDS